MHRFSIYHFLATPFLVNIQHKDQRCWMLLLSDRFLFVFGSKHNEGQEIVGNSAIIILLITSCLQNTEFGNWYWNLEGSFLGYYWTKMYSMVELDGMEKLSPLVIITTCKFKHWQLWKQQFQFGWGTSHPNDPAFIIKKTLLGQCTASWYIDHAPKQNKKKLNYWVGCKHKAIFYYFMLAKV